jgi:pilus assembly protein CpaE
MSKTVHILVVGPDPSLASDFEAAVRGLRDRSVVLHVEAEERRALEEVRSRTPDVVCIEMPEDPRALRALAGEMSATSPSSVLVGVFRRDDFADDQAEGAYLIQALRSQVRDFLRRPVSTEELRDVLRRHVGAQSGVEARGGEGAADPVRASGHVVAFVSNKGGVGKSTLSVNAAALLARRHPGEVLLVDSSLQLGTAGALLDLDSRTDLADAAAAVERLDGTLLRELAPQHESGLHVLAAPDDPLRAGDIEENALSRILGVARRSFRYVIVDTFPVLDAISLAVLDRADRAYVVTSADVPTVVGVERLLALLDRVGFQRAQQRIVLNGSHPQHAASLRPTDVAERLGRVIDHVVPFDKGVLVGGNTGRPHALVASGWFGFGRAMRGLVDDLEGRAMPRTEPDEVQPRERTRHRPVVGAPGAREAGTRETERGDTDPAQDVRIGQAIEGEAS